MPTETLLVSVPIIKVNGSEISNDLSLDLRSMRISLTTGMAGHVELRFYDGDLSHGSSFELDSSIEVIVASGDDQEVSVFKGAVTSVGMEMSPSTRAELIVEALDDARKLGRATSVPSALNQKASEVLNTIARDAGLTLQMETTDTTFDHVQQYGSPIQYLDLLASIYGLDWWVDGTTLHVHKRQDDGAVATLTAGDNLGWFTGRVTAAGLPTSVEVRGWDPVQKAGIVGTKAVSAAMSGIETQNAHTVGGDAKLVIVRPAVPSQAEATAVAEGIARRIATMFVSGRGEAMVTPELKPAKLVTLEGLGETWSKSYHLSSVEHIFGAGRSFMTRFTVGPIDQGGLANLLGAGDGPTGAEQLGTGLTIGTVTDISDPGGYGRVKVSIPALADDHESRWARVVQQGAGEKRGLVLLPEVNDEVVVAFESGDLQRPFVVGGLWNGKDPLPDHHQVIKNGAVMSHSFTTRDGSHVAFVEGESGDACIEVQTAKGKLKMHLGDDLVAVETHDIDFTVKNNKSQLEMLADGAVALTAKGDITISAGAQGNVTIEGNNIELKAQQSLKMQSTANTEIKGTGGVKVESPAITEVKGSLVKLN